MPTVKGMFAHLCAVDAVWLARWMTYKNASGAEFSAPLGPLLQHVFNHATHHRSELATMITLISASPPDTGIATYRGPCQGLSPALFPLCY